MICQTVLLVNVKCLLMIYSKSFNHCLVQMNLDNMIKWSTDWCLYFNTKMSNVLHIGEKNTSCDYFISIGEVDFKLNNSQLIKDLEVTFDPKLNFNHHVYEVMHKATNILSLLKQTFHFFDKKTFLFLYRSLVRPHLEYANIIWYPKYKYQSLSKSAKKSN